jgi:hypothetical protein
MSPFHIMSAEKTIIAKLRPWKLSWRLFFHNLFNFNIWLYNLSIVCLMKEWDIHAWSFYLAPCSVIWLPPFVRSDQLPKMLMLLSLLSVALLVAIEAFSSSRIPLRQTRLHAKSVSRSTIEYTIEVDDWIYITFPAVWLLLQLLNCSILFMLIEYVICAM